VSEDIPCVWNQIYVQLDKQQRMHYMDDIRPPKKWSVSTGSSPRKLEIKHLQMEKE